MNNNNKHHLNEDIEILLHLRNFYSSLMIFMDQYIMKKPVNESNSICQMI